MTEKENTMPLPQNYKDVSNQEFFKNHVLCAQFLRDYSSCKVFAQVQPEDIEDISERFTSIMGTKEEGDTVKRIRLRDAAGEELEDFIPDFAYRLVRIHDYSNADLLDRADEMSLIMLLNKIQTPEDLQEMLKLSGAEVNEIVRDSEENVMDIVCDVVYLLCRKMNLPAEETRGLLTQLKEGRNMGYLFENMEHMDIQAERRERMQAQKSLEDAEEKLDDTEKKLDATEHERDEAYKSCLRLCKKYALQKEEAVLELLKDGSLTAEMAKEIVNRYWELV